MVLSCMADGSCSVASRIDDHTLALDAVQQGPSTPSRPSLGFRPPAPEVFMPALVARLAALRRPAVPAMHALVPKPTLN